MCRCACQAFEAFDPRRVGETSGVDGAAAASSHVVMTRVDVKMVGDWRNDDVVLEMLIVSATVWRDCSGVGCAAIARIVR